MNQTGRRFGYVITDKEFFGVERLGGEYENLRVSLPIPWGRQIAVALFCLHLWATSDQGILNECWSSYTPTMAMAGGSLAIAMVPVRTITRIPRRILGAMTRSTNYDGLPVI